MTNSKDIAYFQENAYRLGIEEVAHLSNYFKKQSATDSYNLYKLSTFIFTNINWFFTSLACSLQRTLRYQRRNKYEHRKQNRINNRWKSWFR